MTSPITFCCVNALGLDGWYIQQEDNGFWEGRWDEIMAEATNQYLYGNAMIQEDHIPDSGFCAENFTELGDSKNWELFYENMSWISGHPDIQSELECVY